MSELHLVCKCGVVSPIPAAQTQRLYNAGWRLGKGNVPMCPKCFHKYDQKARRTLVKRLGEERVANAERVMREKHGF